jgi:chaperonin cofactor prefoldin
LYLEGVDVSYIIEKREDKGPVARIVDMINKQGGRALIMEIEGGKKELNELEIILNEITKTESNISQYVDRAIKDGRALYYYDPELMGSLISKILLGSYCNIGFGQNYIKICNENLRKIGELLLRKKGNIKLERKVILRQYMRLFLVNELNNVMDELTKIKEELENKLKGREYRVDIALSKLNNGIYVQLMINATIDGVSVNPRIQINYYDIKNEKLIKLNSLVIAYKALIEFYNEFTSTK